jgi:hypothetical protein
MEKSVLFGFLNPLFFADDHGQQAELLLAISPKPV